MSVYISINRPSPLVTVSRGNYEAVTDEIESEIGKDLSEKIKPERSGDVILDGLPEGEFVQLGEALRSKFFPPSNRHLEWRSPDHETPEVVARRLLASMEEDPRMRKA